MRPPLGGRRAVALLALGLCLCVGLLGKFVYDAVGGWRETAMRLAARQAEEGVELLRVALLRDMRAVQESVLMSAQLNDFMLGEPHDVSAVVAGAFARYPYPEAFFGVRGPVDAQSLVFFTRTDRMPPWIPRSSTARFPVTVATNPEVRANSRSESRRTRHSGDASQSSR